MAKVSEAKDLDWKDMSPKALSCFCSGPEALVVLGSWNLDHTFRYMFAQFERELSEEAKLLGDFR